jgi:hypothetical protein
MTAFALVGMPFELPALLACDPTYTPQKFSPSHKALPVRFGQKCPFVKCRHDVPTAQEVCDAERRLTMDRRA